MSFTAVAAFVFAAACGDDEEPNPPAAGATRQEVVANFAEVVYRSYDDSLVRTERLRDAIESFLTEPSEARFEYAKRAWLFARDAYGQTEAYRFAGGPIDDEDGPEGRINA